MNKSKKITLSEKEIPKQWYNIAADLPGTINPPLGPDGNPVGPEALAPVFPMNLIEQEVSSERWIDIPEKVLEMLSIWRPAPMVRAYALEEALGIIFNKYLKDDIEFDLVGLNDGIVYIFEIKWRAKETGYRDIEKFMAKTKASEFAKYPMKLIVISRRGFTKQAMKYAKSQKIILVTQNEISKMKNLIM